MSMISDILGLEEIAIKKENEGKFTTYCKKLGYTKVTEECIKKGLKSKDPKVRKRALFALNSRKWKHLKKDNKQED